MPVFDHRGGTVFDLNGARLYAESHGPPDAPVLVLLHGGVGTLEDFNGLAGELREHRLVAIDSRGHGRSTLGAAGQWTYQQVQEDVEAVLQAMKIARCTLVGFSDGGIAGLRIAAAGRVQVDRLVVIGATWHHKNLASSRGILSKVTAESWRRKFPQTYDAYQRLNPEPDFPKLITALVRGWLDESSSGHPGESVARITCPVLIVRGDDDHLTSLADAVELRSRLEDAHFLGIPFAGHVAHDEGRSLFLPALRQFLRA